MEEIDKMLEGLPLEEQVEICKFIILDQSTRAERKIATKDAQLIASNVNARKMRDQLVDINDRENLQQEYFKIEKENMLKQMSLSAT